MATETSKQTRFHKIIVPHTENLYRTAWALTRSHIEAEDLVQETLLKAFNALDKFDGRYPKAWLMTIARNTYINKSKKKKPELLKDPDITFEHSELFADHTDPAALVVDPTFDAGVEIAFNSLRPDARHVVELVDLKGLSYAETAEKLNVPVGTVMSRLHRARNQMKQSLEESAALDGELNDAAKETERDV